MTPQGRAMKQAAIDFGNGQTLPFTPCKKGYIPIVGTKRMMACPLHNKAREKRLAKDKFKFRPGEVDLSKMFWSKAEKSDNNNDGGGGDDDENKDREENLSSKPSNSASEQDSTL